MRDLLVFRVWRHTDTLILDTRAVYSIRHDHPLYDPKQCSTVRYSIVRYNTAHYSAMIGTIDMMRMSQEVHTDPGSIQILKYKKKKIVLDLIKV
jgi:hypothetical protein